MTDEEIFDLAETHGWQDDFGRWNFKDDGLISFALALLKAEREASMSGDHNMHQNDFHPDWDTVKAYDEKFAEMLDEIGRLRVELKQSNGRLHDVAKHCAEVEASLKGVNTAAMNLTCDLTCMEVDNDDRLDRDRVMERVMQWRNEWDKAMFELRPKRGQDIGGHMFNAARVAAQREWVGLTDEEIKEIIGPWGDTPIKGYTRKLFDQIEAKLKEKNT